VLGDDPERVALQRTADRDAAELAASPPAGLEDHDDRKREAEAHRQSHHRVEQLRREKG
jgi:hypothetical protein